MKKALLMLLLLLSIGGGTAIAQQGNTTTIRFAGAPTGGCAPLSFGINSSTGDLYDCVAGVWVKVGSAGGGASPANPSGSIQYNNAGSFGALSEWAHGSADCDGFGDPCDVLITSSSTFRYFLFGTNSNGAAGNNFNCYNYTDGGVYCASGDGTNAASMSFSPTDGNSGMFVNIGSRVTGFNLSSDRVVNIGRIAFSSSYTSSLSSMAFSLGAGWGSTASVTSEGGADNAFVFTVTTGGTGIAANPTVTYTYVDGDFSTSGAAVPVFVCSQSGGNDIVTDVTNTPGQTSVALTWHGTPTTAKTYTISCIGFQRS